MALWSCSPAVASAVGAKGEVLLGGHRKTGTTNNDDDDEETEENAKNSMTEWTETQVTNEFGTAYDIPKVDEGYIDDDKYEQPYRFLTNWYLTTYDSKLERRLPLSKSEGFNKSMGYVLKGKLSPRNPQTHSQISVKVDKFIAWAIDRSSMLRGIWVQSPNAWYWLQAPCKIKKLLQVKVQGEEEVLEAELPSMEETHMELRALSNLISNLIDIFAYDEMKYASEYSKLTADQLFEKLTTQDDVPFDLALCKRNPSFVHTHMLSWLDSLGPKAAFIESLKHRPRGPIFDSEKFLESALAAERRSGRHPWGEPIAGSQSTNPCQEAEEALKRDLVQAAKKQEKAKKSSEAKRAQSLQKDQQEKNDVIEVIDVKSDKDDDDDDEMPLSALKGKENVGGKKQNVQRRTSNPKTSKNAIADSSDEEEPISVGGRNSPKKQSPRQNNLPDSPEADPFADTDDEDLYSFAYSEKDMLAALDHYRQHLEPKPLVPSGKFEELKKEQYHFANTADAQNVMEEIGKDDTTPWERRLVVAFACAQTCEKAASVAKTFFAGKGSCGAFVISEKWRKEALDFCKDKDLLTDNLTFLFLVQLAEFIAKCDVIHSRKGLKILKEKKGIDWKAGIESMLSFANSKQLKVLAEPCVRAKNRIAKIEEDGAKKQLSDSTPKADQVLSAKEKEEEERAKKEERARLRREAMKKKAAERTSVAALIARAGDSQRTQQRVTSSSSTRRYAPMPPSASPASLEPKHNAEISKNSRDDVRSFSMRPNAAEGPHGYTRTVNPSRISGPSDSSAPRRPSDSSYPDKSRDDRYTGSLADYANKARGYPNGEKHYSSRERDDPHGRERTSRDADNFGANKRRPEFARGDSSSKRPRLDAGSDRRSIDRYSRDNSVDPIRNRDFSARGELDRHGNAKITENEVEPMHASPNYNNENIHMGARHDEQRRNAPENEKMVHSRGRGLARTLPAWKTRDFPTAEKPPQKSTSEKTSAPAIGRGRGRGRHLTTPAWMTKERNVGADPSRDIANRNSTNAPAPNQPNAASVNPPSPRADAPNQTNNNNNGTESIQFMARGRGRGRNLPAWMTKQGMTSVAASNVGADPPRGTKNNSTNAPAPNPPNAASVNAPSARADAPRQSNSEMGSIQFMARGRGRGRNLPAWMTKQGMKSVAPPAAPPAAKETAAASPPEVNVEYKATGRGRGRTLPAWMTKNNGRLGQGGNDRPNQQAPSSQQRAKPSQSGERKEVIEFMPRGRGRGRNLPSWMTKNGQTQIPVAANKNNNIRNDNPPSRPVANAPTASDPIVPEFKSSGRGRGRNLPAWMTRQGQTNLGAKSTADESSFDVL